MEIIRFSSNKDLMRGIKLLAGKLPIGIIDGTTYFIPSKAGEILIKNSVKYENVNGEKNKKIIESFKKLILEEIDE